MISNEVLLIEIVKWIKPFNSIGLGDQCVRIGCFTQSDVDLLPNSIYIVIEEGKMVKVPIEGYVSGEITAYGK